MNFCFTAERKMEIVNQIDLFDMSQVRCRICNSAGIVDVDQLKSLEVQFEAQCQLEDDRVFYENLKGFAHCWANWTKEKCAWDCQVCFTKRERFRQQHSRRAIVRRNAEKLRMQQIYQEHCQILGLNFPPVSSYPKEHSDSETDEEVNFFELEPLN